MAGNADSSNRPIAILIADDHPLMRHGIRMALAGEVDLSVVGEAADGKEVLECIEFLNPEVVILDLDMPKGDGFSVVRELNRRCSTVGVIVLTLHTGADFCHEALSLGVRGYVFKSSAATDLAEAIRRIAGGGSFISSEVQCELDKDRAKPELPNEMAVLTPIESRLVRKIAEGFTSRDIATALELSERTIENYRTNICAKLNLTGPNALLRYALSHRKILTRNYHLDSGSL